METLGKLIQSKNKEGQLLFRADDGWQSFRQKRECMEAVAQEFHISVTPLGDDDEYWVRTERVAPGVPLAEEQVRWPVEDWLAQARHLMNDPLLGLLQGDSTRGNPEAAQSSLNLVTLGQKLYNALFQGSLRDSWIIAQAMASKQGSILRLRLGLKGSRLPRLPWEALHAGDRPLATGTDVAFSRYQLSTGLRSQPQPLMADPNQPLKILMVISAPTDQENLALKEEASQLQAELRNRFRRGDATNRPYPAIQLTLLEQPGREQLTQALEQGRYQVFHYAGHSNLSASGGDLYLVSRRTGLTETLSGDDLAGLLVNNGVQMAVFNSCRGAYTAASDSADSLAERNLTEALVKRGISSVLAMAERIPDEVALTLAQLFYRNLSQGYPMDLSLNRARQGLISAYGSHQLYWALPILYVHPEFDGYLTAGLQEMSNSAELLALPDADDFTDEEDVAFLTPALSTITFSADNETDPSAEEFDGYGELDWSGSLDDLDYEDDEYEDDSAFVSGLFQELSQEPKKQQPQKTTSSTQNGSLTSQEAELDAEKEVESYPSVTSPPLRATQTSTATGLKLSPTPQKSHSLSGQAGGWLIPTRLWKWGRSKDGQQKGKGFPWWLLLATAAAALLGFWVYQNQKPQLNSIFGDKDSSVSVPPLPSTSPQRTLNPQELKTADTSAVTNIAIEQFTKGNLQAGQLAVEELLDREALPQAEAALNIVPPQKQDNPAITFLRGRLAWQSVQKGSNNRFALDDARRYWEIAVKKQPKSTEYLNALGFAYYAQGDFNRSIDVLLDALNLAEGKQATAQGSVASKDVLTAYAGLALSMSKSAQKQPADKQAKLLNEAVQMRQKVMTDDPVSFQPEALSKDWLWTEKAIQDWKKLTKK